ncbi:MAG TPA: MFS transporter [Chroococcidiopsis sp.]
MHHLRKPFASTNSNVLLLVLCQALSMTGNVILFTTAALIGQALAPDKSMATVPLALAQIATMIATIPASLLMRRVGRKLGFGVGIFVGLSGAALGLYAILTHQFVWFCLATMLFGSFNSFVGFYRFAAAEVAPSGFRSQAIALVVAGGVAAAVAGPQLASWSKDRLYGEDFAGSFATIAVLIALSLLPLLWVKIPQLSASERQEKGRSLTVIMRQPIFIVAVLGSMLGYGVMVLVMTATPLAMVAHAHPFHEAATVMQWHVLGMFAPSFITGFLIARFGVLPMMTCGGLLSLICIAINLTTAGFLSYSIALLLLGIGWNLLFIGSTTLLTETYVPAEKTGVQAAHDFLMFGFVAFSTILSGSLFQNFGWTMVNLAGIPMMLLVLAAIGWLAYHRTALKSQPTP